MNVVHASVVFFLTSKAYNMIKCIIVICDDKLGQYWTGWEENAPLLIYNVSGWAEEKNPPMVTYNKRCWVLASDSRALSNLVRCIFWEAQYVWNVCAASFEMYGMFEMCGLHLLRCKVWWQRRMWDAQPQLVEQLLSVKVPDAQFDCCWMHFWWSAQCVRCQQCIFCGS